jgi:hypothetical protein
MSSVVQKRPPQRMPKAGAFLPWRPLVVVLVLAFISVFAALRTNTFLNVGVTSAPAIPFATGRQVALADFDGDIRPDSASVQPASEDFGATTYWIRVQLSKVGLSFIRLDGPAGGLWIQARDVNGDHAIDLVLSTAWQGAPVAVLLNDGHGNFSRAEGSKFPGAFTRSEYPFLAAPPPELIPVGTLPTVRTFALSGSRTLARGALPVGSIGARNQTFFSRLASVRSLGRAPPPIFL